MKWLTALVRSSEIRTLVGSGLLLATSTSFALLNTWWLPARDRGVVVLFLTTAALTMLPGTLGVSVSGRRLVALQPGISPEGYLNAAQWLGIAHLGTALIVGVPLLELSGGRPSLLAAVVFVCFAPILLYSYLVKEMLHGLGLHTVATYSDVPSNVTFLGGTIFLKLTGLLSVESTLAVILIGGMAQLMYCRWFTRRWRGPAPAGDPTLRELIRTGLPALGSVLGSALIVRGDRLLLGALAGSAAVGVYGLAATLGELLWICPIALSQFVFRRAVTNPSSPRLDHLWRINLAVTCVMGIAAAILTPPLIRELFSASYESAAGLAWPAVVACLPMASFYLDSAALNGLGLFRTVSRITYCGLVVMLISGVVLIPATGALGAVVASGLSYATMGGASRYYLIRARRRSLNWKHGIVK